jgi:hypothetical protein
LVLLILLTPARWPPDFTGWPVKLVLVGRNFASQARISPAGR